MCMWHSFGKLSAQIPTTGYNHVALAVKDISESAKFYREVVGLTPTEVPDNLKGALARRVVETLTNFRKQHGNEIDQWWKGFDAEFEREQKSGQASPLDNISPQRIVAAVTDSPMTLALLMESVKAKAEPRGTKAALARTLHVTPQQVNDWLTGRSKPNGEDALQLFLWVNGKLDLKTKSAVSGTTPTTQTRTARDQGNENEQPEP